jgi:hypothetical protein
MTVWTPEETQRLYVAANAGKRFKTIARELGRTLHSVQSKLSEAYLDSTSLGRAFSCTPLP